MRANDVNLTIVALRDVILHEEIEAQRVEMLQARLGGDRVLKNPPIVAPVRDGAATRYIVLDGASRTSALRALRVPDVLAQIVDYHSPALKLEAWHHLLLDIAPARVRQILETSSDLELINMDEARAQRALEARDILAYVKFSDGALVGLRGQRSLAEQMRALNELVRAYEAQAELYRVPTTTFETHVQDPHRFAALVAFPKYQPDEIVNLALNGARLPMGITRHIIPGRALRVNLPLDILENAQTLSEKNAWLDAWLVQKMRDHRVRFYQEPVFLFDE